MVQGRENPAMICLCQKVGIGEKSGGHRRIYKACDVPLSTKHYVHLNYYSDVVLFYALPIRYLLTPDIHLVSLFTLTASTVYNVVSFYRVHIKLCLM